jgi:acyl dehydratase
MTQPTTYITDELKSQLNVERDKRVSPPVSLSDIRKWAIAVYYPDVPPRIYWDEEYAKTTKWGGIIAPPDFNPFAWAMDEQGWEMRRTVGKWPESTGDAPAAPGTTGINAGGEAQYFAPIRPGDVITSTITLVDLYERTGRLGLMLFTVTENRWTNQNGEKVKIYRGTGIRY